jgi:hypothetical protein
MTRRNNRSKKHLPRNLATDWGDKEQEATTLAMWGFGNAFIEARTGLSQSQITYSLRWAGLSTVRTDYRHGEGIAAEYLLQHTVRNQVVPVITRAVEQTAKKKEKK